MQVSRQRNRGLIENSSGSRFLVYYFQRYEVLDGIEERVKSATRFDN